MKLQAIRLTNTVTGESTIVEGNKTVVHWLWDNYYRLGYDQMENLTLMQVQR